MKEDPLSARLLVLGDDLKHLATLASSLNPQLANAILFHAVRAGLASTAATALERTLRSHERALEEARANAAEEAAQAEATAPCVTLEAMRQRHARAQTIAAMMAPVLPRPRA